MTSNRARTALLFLLVALYAVVAAGYFVLRYQGRWIESDTANLTATISATLEEGTLVTEKARYALGYAYQAFVGFLAKVSGVPALSLQLWILPVAAALLSGVAYVAYCQLTGDAAAGALAALLLFMQPTFLFVVFRGSHEKMTWFATLLALYALPKSFSASGILRRAALYVAVFYLAVFTLISSNAFFASSFIAAVAFSLVAGFVLLLLAGGRRGQGGERSAIGRLLYVLLSTMVIWVIVIFYVYKPASTVLLELNRGADQTAAVALGAQPKFDPYATVGSGWVSPGAYLGLMLPTWIVMGLSFAIWAFAGLRWLFRKERPETPGQLLLWLLYGGFGLQLAGALVLDQAAAISGNLQLRVFPVVTVVALPLVTAAMVRRWRQARRPWARAALTVLLLALVLWSGASSLLKATNDPALSNYWMFFTHAEENGKAWAEGHLLYRGIWLGIDGIRLGSYAVASGMSSRTGNASDVWTLSEETRHLLVSNVEEELVSRMRVPVPDVQGEDRVYDNGDVALYRLRPRTPYQR